jgi:hypothetical protein
LPGSAFRGSKYWRYSGLHRNGLNQWQRDGAPKITSRRLPPAPGFTGALAAAVSAVLFIVVLRFYRERAGLDDASRSNTSPWTIAYAIAVLIFIPLIFAADGCGGAAPTAPAAQKSSIVTPSGTSTLVITPTATNASGKALQMPLIQLMLIVN